MKKIFLLCIILIFIIFTFPSCRFFSTDTAMDEGEASAEKELLGLLQQNNEGEEPEAGDDIPINNPASAYPVPSEDGLHITGKPIEIDIDEYKLEITGEVKNPFSLTFQQVKEMKQTRIYAELDCPGFFIDKGYWTGVEIKDLLELAEVKDEAEHVQFISYDENYKKSVLIDDVFSRDGFLVAYHFDDDEFSEINGYPLRIVAKGEIGSIWVKWLGKIEVLSP